MKKKNEQLVTERLTLHPICTCDETQVMRILFNEQIKKTYMIPDFNDEEQARKLFLRLIELGKDERHFVFGVYLDKRLIGFVNDCGMDETTAELGYVILPEYHRRGYATEAVCACIDELFGRGLQKVTAGYFEGNDASRRVMEKCGMHPTAREENIEYKGTTHRCIYCEIEKKDRQ